VRQLVEEAIATVADRFGVSWNVRQLEAFAPAQPVPTHRIAEPVS